jgi:hypothetical protein
MFLYNALPCQLTHHCETLVVHIYSEDRCTPREVRLHRHIAYIENKQGMNNGA